VLILTKVSPLLNFLSSHSAGEVPRRSQMASTSNGWELPEKILTRRMVSAGRFSKKASGLFCCTRPQADV